MTANSKLIITADEGLRGGKKVPLKVNTDEALKKCAGNEKVIVVRRTGGSRCHDAGPRPLVSRGSRKGFSRLQAGEDEGGRSAVHPLYLGLDRQAQGRACTRPAAISSMPR